MTRSRPTEIVWTVTDPRDPDGAGPVLDSLHRLLTDGGPGARVLADELRATGSDVIGLRRDA